MKQLIRYISLVVVCICTFLLSGCSFVWTTENGDPATPEDIKASVEKEFAVVHPNLVLQSSVVEQEKPFQRNVYVFYDESNGFSFTTNSVVQRPTLPVPGGERYTNANFAYSQEYLIHLNAALVERAKQHGLRMATYEEVLKLKKSEATRVAGNNKIPLFRSNEIIFVDKSVKGEDILTIDCQRVAVFFDSYRCGKIICFHCCLYLNVLIVRSRPVSYTHLDVYKRQEVGCSADVFVDRCYGDLIVNVVF